MALACSRFEELWFSLEFAVRCSDLAGKSGGRNWIRTSEGVSQQIYSLPPLATWVSYQPIAVERVLAGPLSLNAAAVWTAALIKPGDFTAGSENDNSRLFKDGNGVPAKSPKCCPSICQQRGGLCKGQSIRQDHLSVGSMNFASGTHAGLETGIEIFHFNKGITLGNADFELF